MSEHGYIPIPAPGVISKKPPHLVTVASTGKGRPTLFVSLDRPELLTGFIQVKGFYTSLPEEEVIGNYVEVISSTSKDNIIDLLLPTHMVLCIRNIVFNAQKPTTAVKKGFE